MTPSRPALTAALWMIGAIVAFTSMAVSGRAVSAAHDTFEIMLFRSVIGLGIVVAIAGSLRRLHEVRFDRLGLHALRNIAHFSGQNLWFFAVTVAPLAQVFALEFTSPIWVIILAPLFLGERFTAIKAGCALAGFLGILLVARPDVGGLSAGVITAALAAIGFAGTAICTKRLTEFESITSILFWLTAMQLVLGLVFAGWDGQITLPTTASLPWLCLIAVAGLVAHFCLTTALSLAPASVVMPMDFARLPVIAVVGAVFYDETLSIWVVLGAGLIILANWVNIRTSTSVKPTI